MQPADIYRRTMLRSLKSITKRQTLAVAALAIATQLGCSQATMEPPDVSSLKVTSSSFAAGTIPKKHVCGGQGGQDISPELSWSTPPAGTTSFALIVTDKDAPLGPALGYFTHWTLYDIPTDQRELPEGVPEDGRLDDGTRQGQNDFGRVGYGGPCPPGKSPHRYIFSVYALDAKLGLPAGAREKAIEDGMKGHILAKGEIIVRYGAGN